MVGDAPHGIYLNLKKQIGSADFSNKKVNRALIRALL
jgi:hypothetical protein